MSTTTYIRVLLFCVPFLAISFLTMFISEPKPDLAWIKYGTMGIVTVVLLVSSVVYAVERNKL